MLARLAVAVSSTAGTALLVVLGGMLILDGGHTEPSAVRLPVTGGELSRTTAPLVPTVPTASPSQELSPPAPAPAATAEPRVVDATPELRNPEPRIVAAKYVAGGRTHAGLTVQVGTMLVARFDGSIEVRLYQLIGGSIRIGSNDPSLPFFPYITVTSADRRMTYRPGALGLDTDLLVRDGQLIGAGEPLFRQIGPGRASWATFYDASSRYQVVVSLQALPSGRDLDPLGYFSD